MKVLSEGFPGRLKSSSAQFQVGQLVLVLGGAFGTAVCPGWSWATSVATSVAVRRCRPPYTFRLSRVKLSTIVKSRTSPVEDRIALEMDGSTPVYLVSHRPLYTSLERYLPFKFCSSSSGPSSSTASRQACDSLPPRPTEGPSSREIARPWSYTTRFPPQTRVIGGTLELSFTLPRATNRGNPNRRKNKAGKGGRQ